ncbi:uncharacterized protein LOC119406569 [Rhipicephalus sanguineus]|uniref:uncharacterized protein LOC119406569 n=1 Tax=Rhipicephalus sanguineus TaxID=34632 RepID=UPI0020C48224|nr:uncharacterized protein LOC119406569 [Rhipicephalus sanguineus]
MQQSFDNQAGGDGIVTLLSYLASNLSVKSMEVTREMLEGQAGEALAGVVRRHVALNKLEINGSTFAHPEAVLKAAVKSPSLKTLNVNECRLSTMDIHNMGEALSRPPPSRASVLGGASASEPPTSVLENLSFTNCRKANAEEQDFMFQVTFAMLISGGLRQLSLNDCRLTYVFAMMAARQLRADSRLQHLYVQKNNLTLSGIRMMLKSLEVNTTLDVLGIDMWHHPHQFVVYKVITDFKLSSRLVFSWENPLGLEFVRGHELCSLSSVYLNFNRRVPVDTQVLLDELKKCTRTKQADMYCTARSKHPMPLLLVNALRNLQHLRCVYRYFRCVKNRPMASILFES